MTTGSAGGGQDCQPGDTALNKAEIRCRKVCCLSDGSSLRWDGERGGTEILTLYLTNQIRVKVTYLTYTSRVYSRSPA